MIAHARLLALFALLALAACERTDARSRDDGSGSSKKKKGSDKTLPLSTDTLRPTVITDTVPGESDDPAIWVNGADPTASVVLGTDKGDSTGGVYVFTLDGHIDRTRSVTPLRRMNNVDVEYDVDLGGKRGDIAVATERLGQAIRVFTLPGMTPIDGGGITVFNGDTERAPMGIAIYKRPRDGQVFAIVGGKSGPATGYLAQYALQFTSGRATATLVREFGAFSGKKEIEAIVVDDALGYVYYSDERVGVRKYHADPDSGNAELTLIATTGIRDDHEGLAIYQRDAATGYIVLSDQGAQRIHVFPREGTAGQSHVHPLLAVIPVVAQETDGLDITARPMGGGFPTGMLAMMSNRGAFHFYQWSDVQRRIDAVVTGGGR